MRGVALLRVAAAVCFLPLVTVIPVGAELWSEIVSGRIRISNFATGFQADGEDRPSVFLRAAELQTEHERRGFVRIGALPYLVLNKVELQMRWTPGLSNSLARMRLNLSGPALRRVELRNVTIVASGLAGTNVLQAASIELRGANEWLLKNARFDQGALSWSADRATLCVAGRDIGRLTVHSTPARTIDLFASVENP